MILTAQLVPFVIMPPDKLTLVFPATGAGEKAPAGQVLPMTRGEATARFVGKVSENATPLRSAVEFGLVRVNVIVEVPLVGMLAGEKAFAIDGGVNTVTVAEAVFPVPPFVEVTAPVVLFCVPAAVPVTFTEKLQLLFVGMVAPERLTLFIPCAAVIAPPSVAQEPPLSPFGVDTANPAGSVSVKATPVSEVVFATGFVIVNVKLVVPFTGIVAAPKAFAIDGGATTVSVAVLLAVPVPPLVELIAPVVLL